MADTVTFKVEGKDIPIPRDVVRAGLEAVQAVLVASGFPASSVADIRMPDERTGAPAVVTPRSTGKGAGGAPPPWLAGFLAGLEAAPEFVNPAVALAARVRRAELDGDEEFVERAVRSGELERAVHEGQREGARVAKILRACGQAAPAASATVPDGF